VNGRPKIDDLLKRLAPPGKTAGEPAPLPDAPQANDPDFNPAPPHASANAAPTIENCIPEPPSERRSGTIDLDASEFNGNPYTEIYRPEDSAESSDAAPEQFEDILVAQGIVAAQEIVQAQAVVKQSPGTRITDVLVGRGADERAVLQVLAESWSLGFESIDLSKGPEIGRASCRERV